MTDPYYSSEWGYGTEGILNYVNEITNTLFSSLFLIFIFIITVYTLSKSEWKMNSVFIYAFFLLFISSMIMQLFVRVNPLILYASIIGLAISTFVGIWTKNL